MSEDARLHLVEPRGIAEYVPLEAIQDDEHAAQGIVGDIAGAPARADEAQVQQATDAAALVVQTERQSTL